MSSPQGLARRPDPGRWKAISLTVLVHALLIGALFVGVRWQNRGPEAVSVEVWQAPAPPAPAPAVPPKATPAKAEAPVKADPPPKPEIATHAAKPEVKKVEAKKTPAEPPRPSFDEALRREQAQLDHDKAISERRERAEQEARALQETQAAQASAARTRALADYTARIRGKIRGNLILPPGVIGNPESVFEVVQLPTGEVLSVKLKKSGGNAALDAAVERAILKSSPLPKPPQAELFQRVLELKYRPVEDG